MESHIAFLLAIMTLLAISETNGTPAHTPIESIHDILVYPMEPPMNIRKRDTSAAAKNIQSNGDFIKFVEDKLLQHTRALEHLLGVSQSNMDLTKKLTDSFSSFIAEPKLPEKLQLTSRRSMEGGQESVPAVRSSQSISPWCPVAMVCRRTLSPVCGYDDNFGYGKFDDVCHMLQVNCYWKYNFSLVAHCRPILN